MSEDKIIFEVVSICVDVIVGIKLNANNNHNHDGKNDNLASTKIIAYRWSLSVIMTVVFNTTLIKPWNGNKLKT